MPSFDHFALPVANYEISRDWYVQVLGLELEFDAAGRRTAAVRDADGLTVFLYESKAPPEPAAFALWLRVQDVERMHRELCERGIAFSHGPQKVEWGYGAELRDPTGYRICLWDERTMPKS